MQKVFIIGGLGHIGLTLAAVLSKHYKVVLFDINDRAVDEFKINRKATFYEPGLNELLLKNAKNIEIAHKFEEIKDSNYVIATVGTYTDAYLNPVLKHVFYLFKQLSTILTNQTVILRSTMYPGMTKKLEKLFKNSNVKLAFCPERVQSGNMVKELQTLPQIISANSDEALQNASKFFAPLKLKQKLLKDTTAGELAKLMTNAYRYVEFSIANQFFEMTLDAGCDFYEIFDVITDGYPRLKNLPRPGFSGGSCIRKDTMQLAAWYNGPTFSLGHNASIINEGVPLFVFRKMRKKYKNLDKKVIGILGMAFKPGCDDIRDSLSYRLKHILENEVKEVLCSDPYVESIHFININELLEKSDVIILATPHEQYKNIETDKPIVDIWNFLGKGIGI